MKDADRNSEPLDAVLRRAMREPPAAATPQCADAESIAAYWDGSIAAAERERLEAHFADCARCQTQLAAIARADESARAASAASKAPWYRRWQLAIPAFAAAAAVAVFIAIKRPEVEQPRTPEVVAMAKREAPAITEQAPAPAAPATAPPAAALSAPKQLAMNEPRTRAAPRAEAKSAPSLHRMETGVGGSGKRALAPAPAQAPAGAGRVVAIAPAAPFAAPSAPAQPAASASSEAAMNQPQAEAAQRPEARGYTQLQQRSSAAASRGGAIAAPQAGAAPAGAGAAVGGASIGAASGAIVGGAVGHPSAGAAVGTGTAIPATGQIIARAPASGANYTEPWTIPARASTPDHSVTWIVGKNGTVQRRDASGVAHIQHSGVTTDLTAGAAPSASVCWIVGRSGTIIRTTDGGEHWTLIAPPVGENFAAVSASSANDATIATASGRRFATSDGGVSWRAQ